MASKRSEINSINSFENRPILKNLNIGKPKGLKVRETGRNEDNNKRGVDENVYTKPKMNIFTKANQRSPLVVIPGPPKPAFTIYCDDDVAQDSYNTDTRQNTASKVVQDTAHTDISVWPENKDEKDAAEATVSDIPVPKIGLNIVKEEDQENRKNEDYDDEVFLSTVDDELTTFHTAQYVPEKLELRPEEQISCHPDYVKDIYLYMRDREVRLSPNPRYLRKQTDISSEMRYILVDWLADVTVEYDLSLECLHLAVSIVDRTLSLLYCPRLKLQLVGATAIMIAAKFEEIFPPELKEFVYITDETYSAVQILRMEKVILNTLRFEISAPTSNWFGARLARIAQCDKQTFFLMNYLLELALLDYRYLHFRSSVLASSAFCLANAIIGSIPWSSVLESDTGISMDELREPMQRLLASFAKAPRSEHKAVYEKYSDEKYRAVACLLPPSSLPVN